MTPADSLRDADIAAADESEWFANIEQPQDFFRKSGGLRDAQSERNACLVRAANRLRDARVENVLAKADVGVALAVAGNQARTSDT